MCIKNQLDQKIKVHNMHVYESLTKAFTNGNPPTTSIFWPCKVRPTSKVLSSPQEMASSKPCGMVDFSTGANGLLWVKIPEQNNIVDVIFHNSSLTWFYVWYSRCYRNICSKMLYASHDSSKWSRTTLNFCFPRLPLIGSEQAGQTNGDWDKWPELKDR